MKSKLKVFSTLLLAILFLNFTYKIEIPSCFLSFTTSGNLTAANPERLPESAEKYRVIPTDSGQVEVSRIDGYRILYNNEKHVPFVNMKVERSKKDSYKADQNKLIDNLNYLNAHSEGMETKDLIVLEFNGYKIYGSSRNAIQQGSTLGTFIMFPGNDITVYFYFNNLKPEYRNFESLEDYKKQRDNFMKEYTKFLTLCDDK